MSLSVTAAARARVGYAALSERELEVLRLRALGHDDDEAARVLEISSKTVKCHRYNAVAVLGIPAGDGRTASHTAIIATAIKHGLITLDQLLEEAAD